MKRGLARFLSIPLIVISLLVFAVQVYAEDFKMVGVITKLSIAGKSATTATATLKDVKTDKLVTITINDDLTLDKFKDGRIREGDEIRCKYETVGGKNISKIFRKTAGC